MADEKNPGKTSGHKVAAIVAAYNEAERVGAVLDVLTTYPDFDEIIVVDDGSKDSTSQVVRKYNVSLIRHDKNLGKGRAMDDAVASTSADIIFFCDADVRGLTHTVIRETLEPVLSSRTDMMIAMRNRKIYFLSFIFAFIPLLGGERALTRELWLKTPARYKQRFMIEAGLNFYARHYGRGFYYKAFPGLTQTIKEKKYGLWTGIKGRVRMFAEVYYAQIVLQMNDTPKAERSGRIALATIGGSMLGLAVGAALLYLAYSGIQDAIAYAAGAVGVLLIGLNLLLILTNIPNLRHLAHRTPLKRLE